MSKSYIPSAPVDNTALIADIVGQININTNAKATATQNVVVADGDVTQGQLGAMTVVDGQLDTNVADINSHTTAEFAALSLATIKPMQRGTVIVNSSADVNVVIASVDVSKSTLVVSSEGGIALGEITSPTNILFLSSSSANRLVSWELIEYV